MNLDASGAFTHSFRVTVFTAAGRYKLTATNVFTGVVASMYLTVS